MSTEVIEVRIWGSRVGAVAAHPASRSYAFEYAPEWTKRRIELAPLAMPVGGGHIFEFPGLGESFHGLPGLVADSLPDHFGNALIDAWMEQKGVRRDSITALDRLAYMGRRGLGALEFHPIRGGSTESAKPLEMKSLVEDARRFVSGNFEGDGEARAALANIIRVGTSAGGARAKAVLAWNPTTGEIRSGQFDVEPGFEHWLLKFDGLGADDALGTSADYGRIEYAYHLMATRLAGIDMAPCRLLQENGRAHFMTRRFDRDRNTKHHLQTLCAMRHLDFQMRGTHAYEQYFAAIADLGLGDGGPRAGVPADGVQRDGPQLRRPHQELLVPAEAGRRVGARAGLRRHACAQPCERVDAPAPDERQREVRRHRGGRPPRGRRPLLRPEHGPRAGRT